MHALTATVIRDEMGLTLEKAHKDMLGSASKVIVTKDSTLILTDGSTNEAVKVRITQLQRLVEVRLQACNIYASNKPSNCMIHFSCFHRTLKKNFRRKL